MTVHKVLVESSRTPVVIQDNCFSSQLEMIRLAALQQTRNLAAVTRVMGHSDPKIAMHYQHPDLEQIRVGLNGGSRSSGFTVQ